LIGGCSTKKKVLDLPTPDLVHFDSLEGEVHQLTTIGENSQIDFSPSFNLLVFVRSNPNKHRSSQIYIKNMIDKTEKQITYNIGENASPSFHPFKKEILFSSTSDESIENINVEPLLKDLGLAKMTDPTTQPLAPYEIYLTNEDGNNTKRLTHSRGYDSLGHISFDGKSLYYVTQDGSQMMIVKQNLNGGEKKIILKSASPITSLSLSDKFLAYTTDQSLVVQSLLKPEIILQQNGRYFADVAISPNGKTLLVISQYEDEKNKDVYELDLEKKCRRRLTFHPLEESSPSFGPGETSLFFVSHRSGRGQIYSTMIRQSLPCAAL